MKIKNYIKQGALCLALSGSLFAQSITDVTGPGGYAITAFDRESTIRLGGYYDTDFKYDKKQLVMDNHHLILEAAAQLHPKVLFNTEIEFEHGGTIIKMEQAWVDFSITDSITNRIGLIVVPFGRLNLLHDSDVRDTTNRPAYAKVIVPTSWCDTGFGFHGVKDINEEVQINYEAYVVNGMREGLSSSGTKSMRNDAKKINGTYDNNKNQSFAGRLGVSPTLGMEFGTSLYTGKYDNAGKLGISLMGLDAQYKTGPFDILAEYAAVSADNTTGGVQKMFGYYIEGRYHYIPSWLSSSLIGRGFKNPHFTLIGRFGVVDPDTSVTNTKDNTQYTLGVNYRPTETVVYKFEYEMNSLNNGDTQDAKVYASVAVGF